MSADVPSMFRRPARDVEWSALLILLFASVTGCEKQTSLPRSLTSDPPLSVEKSATEPNPAAIRFFDKALSYGIDWTYRNGEEAERYAIVESMGGGVGLGDYDRDGQLDVLLAGGGIYAGPRALQGLPLGLFRQQSIGVFAEVSQASALAASQFYHHGISLGDYDNDGFPDLAVTGYGGIQLFHNGGDGTWQQDTANALQLERGWGISACWGDVNGDGAPDLVVANYADWSFDNDPACPGPAPHPRDVCPPRRFHGLVDQLFLSDGQGGFRDVAAETGVVSQGKGIGVALADLDLDGDLDLYVTNDTDPNNFYRNDGRGQFEEIGLASGVALSADGNADGSMGVDVGDLNGDGLPDLWVTNYERETFALYQNQKNLQFQHISRLVGVTGLEGTYVGWGTIVFDADGDGDQDIFVANGHVVRYPTLSAVRQLPLLLENVEHRRFRDVAETTGDYFREPHPGRGVAMGDIDNDGDPDLVVSHLNEPVAVLVNESPDWQGIGLRLIGRNSPREPIGAQVRMYFNGRMQAQQLKRASSYASTSENTLFFGTGNQSIARVEIDWPSGVKQTIDEIPRQRIWTIIEPIASSR